MMNATDTSWAARFEPVYGDYSPLFPNPIICLSEILGANARVFYASLIPWNGIKSWFAEFWEMHHICMFVTMNDIYMILLMALFFTLLRIVFYKTLLERIPKWYKLNKEDAEKFPEAAFRTITYSGLWTFTCYAIFKTDLFYIPYSAWTGWIPGIQMPNDMYWVYMLEMGFYLHMMYATTYVETVRKDYVVQMLHHVLTLVLLLYSYSVRFHNIGVFVIFIHDIADILLELAKCFIYFKVMNGVPNKVADMLANITFVLFVLQWILFRLYWFPVKLMYIVGCTSYTYFWHLSRHFYTPFNLLLWILYFLHVYWFYFIIRLVVKIAMGDEIEDNRDFEEDDEKKDSKKKE